MTNTPRLVRSGIEYLTHVWDFYTGCLHAISGICPVGDACWANIIVERFAFHYPNGFTPELHEEALLSPLYARKPAVIGVCFTGDLFGVWVDPHRKIRADLPSGVASISMSLKGWVFTTMRQCPQHKFMCLTKAPWNLPNWGQFPDNAWVGATVCNDEMLKRALQELRKVDAKHKWLSIEPMLERLEPAWLDVYLQDAGIEWLVIGAATGSRDDLGPLAARYPELKLAQYHRRWSLQPDADWVREVLDEVSVPVWLKDNVVLPKESVFYTWDKRVCDECEPGDPCGYCGQGLVKRQQFPLSF